MEKKHNEPLLDHGESMVDFPSTPHNLSECSIMNKIRERAHIDI